MADKFIHFIPSIRRSLLSISAAWSLLLIFSLVSAQTLRLQFPDISNPFYKALFFAIFLSLIQQGITFYAADSIMLRKRQIALISLWLAAGWIGGNIIPVQPAHDIRFLWVHLSVASGRTEIPMGNRKSYRNDSRPDHNLLPVCHAESEYPEEICA